MRRSLFVLLALTLALSTGALARSLGLPNELINGSWEMGSDLGWLRNGGDVVDLTTYFANPGPAPGELDLFGYGIASSWGINTGSISQDVYCAPDVYTVDLSGWLRVMDGGMAPSWIELQLLVDDVLVGAQRVQLAGAGGFTDTGWTYVEVRWAGFIAGKKTARVEGVADAWGGPGEWPWGIVVADGIDMEQIPGIIPEPCSLLALGAGLAALAIRRRR